MKSITITINSSDILQDYPNLEQQQAEQLLTQLQVNQKIYKRALLLLAYQEMHKS